MSLFFNKILKTLTVSDNSGTLDMVDPIRGVLAHLVVRSESDNTIFDFALKDKDLDFVIWQRESVTQEINEDIEIPLQGNYEVVINNVTANEDFRIYMAVREI